MSDKKKNWLDKLFKPKNDCGCGVQVVSLDDTDEKKEADDKENK